jgi:hypothetical protein
MSDHRVTDRTEDEASCRWQRLVFPGRGATRVNVEVCGTSVEVVEAGMMIGMLPSPERIRREGHGTAEMAEQCI